MKLGTVVYSNKIYNLDYMSIDEMKELLKKIESEQMTSFKDAKNLLKDKNNETYTCCFGCRYG